MHVRDPQRPGKDEEVANRVCARHAAQEVVAVDVEVLAAVDVVDAVGERQGLVAPRAIDSDQYLSAMIGCRAPEDARALAAMKPRADPLDQRERYERGEGGHRRQELRCTPEALTQHAPPSR